ncbi:ATP-binding protein [Bacillus sp. JCM 19034]|uniref:ATP-binding protein n=1 Tax=Bacillus sp. JCM 19034 TaxID=1481928 RepID=UPI00078170E5|nr:ATP-binding protein [Bacillus sp. JCM 19034]
MSEMNRIETILNELLVLAKPQATKFASQDVIELLSSVVTLFETQGNLNNIQIAEEYLATDRMIECDENQIKQVFINFIKNSMEAMTTGGGKITLHVSNENADFILIRVIDEGCGIPNHVLERLGEPFYSTKEKGTGLGMMVSNKIIKDHKGKVNIISEINKGTTIEIWLPVSKGELDL